MALASRLKQFWLTAATLAFVVPAAAQAIFENWNGEACATTNVAMLTLDRATYVERIDLWFQWRDGESAVRYSVSHNGAPFAEGDLARAECDPNQRAWCVARVEPNADLDAGVYRFRTAEPRVCQNASSGGQGFIRAYGAAR